MRSSGRILAGAALIAAAMVGVAPPAGAAEGNGCSASAVSIDGDGKRIDAAAAPGAGGTSDRPLDVDPAGRVRWEAEADPPIPDGTWKVQTDSTPRLSFGGDGGLESESGTENMKGRLTVKVPILGTTRLISGKFKVEVVVEGGGNTCTLSGYVKVAGSPLGTPVLYVGVALGLLGLFLALGAMPSAAPVAAAAAPVSPPAEVGTPASSEPPIDTTSV